MSLRAPFPCHCERSSCHCERSSCHCERSSCHCERSSCHCERSAAISSPAPTNHAPTPTRTPSHPIVIASAARQSRSRSNGAAGACVNVTPLTHPRFVSLASHPRCHRHQPNCHCERSSCHCERSSCHCERSVAIPSPPQGQPANARATRPLTRTHFVIARSAATWRSRWIER